LLFLILILEEEH